MQPYFFPYIGYFDLINRTDRWVIFDVVRPASKGWLNRNRILHPTAGWQYINVPLDHASKVGAIKDVRMRDKAEARRQILAQVDHYRTKRAPFFEQARALIDRGFEETPGDKIAELNTRTLAGVCEYLGIPFQYTLFSTMGLQLPQIEHPGQWAVEIAAALHASEYINPPNGRPFLRPEEFERHGIALTFTEQLDYKYDCKGYAFVENLSILDVIMWNDPTAIKAFLDDVKERSLPNASR